MYKQLHLKLLLLLFMVLGAGTAWGEDIVVTLDNIGNDLGSTANTTAATTDITATGTTDCYTLNYYQCKKQGSAMLLTKSVSPYISNKTAMPGNIKSVEVFINSGAAGKTTYDCAFSTTECTSATSGIGAVNITGGNSNTFSNLTNGNINVAGKYFCITLGNANNGQVLKLVITCEGSSNSAAATTTTIDDSSITNTDVYTSTAAGSLSASVTSGENPVANATVSWSGNNNTVATIDASTGAVTLVAAGKVTFTASYAGVEDKYQASSATYEMTVTSSAPYAQPTEFDIDLNNSLFGTTYSGSASGITDDKPVSGSKENVVVTYAGSGNHYINDSQIRFYPNNKLTFEAPSGYNITKIVFTADGTWAATISADNGTYTSTTKTWTGEATTVLFTGSGSSRCDMSKVAITLSLPDERTTTNVTIDASGITNTNVYTGTAAGQLVATVKAGETTLEGASVTWKGDNSSVATIAADGTVTLVGAGNVTFTATYAGDESNYKGSNAEYALTVVNEDPNVPGASAENPYTVAQAIAATPESGTSANVYIRGIVSSFYNSNSSITDDATYHRYYISDNGTTTDQLMVFNGKGLNNVAFSNTDDLELGDEVIIYGGLTTYNSTKEIAADNHIVSLTRKEAATITVTGGTEFTIDRTQNEEELTLTATANSGATVVFTLDSENTTLTEGTHFDFEDGYMVFYTTKGGIITVKANAPAAGNYKAAEEVTITITVVGEKEAPVIAVNSTETVAYGSTFTVDDSMIEGGAITVTSSNTAVATVSGLTITPVAVGTTTITVATAENDTYKAGSETFTLTVTAPEGLATAKPGTISSLFTDKDFANDGGLAWTSNVDGRSFETSGNARGVQIGAAKGEYTIEATNTATVTKVELVVSTNNTDNTIAVSVGGVDFKCNDASSVSLSKDNNYTCEFTGNGTGNIIISVNNTAKTVWFKSITVYTSVGTESATLNASGYATYCSQYPLDFSGATDYSAWQITDISKSNEITFEKVTGDVKGGTGLFLMGTAGATISLTSKNSSTELGNNMLEGTLAPMYFAAGEIYGLAGETFKKNSAGTIKANKAYLDAGWINDVSGGSTRAFTFIFVDPTTGITETQTVSAEEFGAIFNLAGQRVSQPQKGVNIINGKKVLIK